MRARVETCSGWQLAKYSEARDFIILDLPLFHNVQHKDVPGKVPELFLINRDYEYTESFRIDLLSREENNKLLKALGFYRKDAKDGEVPADFTTGPYVRNEAEMAEMYSILEVKELEEVEAQQKEKEEKEKEEIKADSGDETGEDKTTEAEPPKDEKAKTETARSHEEAKYTKEENEPVKDDL